MFETLCDAIDGLTSQQKGLRFTEKGKEVSRLNYGDLRPVACSLARKLNACGLRPGDRVVLVEADQARFAQLFLAAVRAGLVLVPFPPPTLGSDLQAYCDRLKRVLTISTASRLISGDGRHRSLKEACQRVGIEPGIHLSWNEIAACREYGELASPSATDAAMLQFTSGSTGMPRGIELSHRNLITNAHGIQKALDLAPSRDKGVSWLPFHHDMGLIGFLITPVLTQSTTHYLPPTEFARKPARWLDLLARSRASISFAPCFAYELVNRSVKVSNTASWDLSQWRVAGCGGEAVQWPVLKRFASQLSASGFKPDAFAPCYGLAEATVAVTMTGADKHSRDYSGRGAPAIVSSGTPIHQTEVRILNAQGRIAAELEVGEIQVRGPGVASRVWSESGFQTLTCRQGWLSSGDLGFICEGQLYVSGRKKETILINGCNYFPQDIEACVLSIDGLKPGGVVAFGRPANASEQLVIVVEASRSVDRTLLSKQVRQSLRQHSGLAVSDVVLVRRGTIERTSSGKLKRVALRDRYIAGELQG